MTQREPRYRLLSIRPDELLTLLWEWRRHQIITLPVLADLPADCEILEVHYTHSMRAFEFLLWHPSFPEVPDGGLIPSHGTFQYEVVRFERPKGDEPIVVDRR